MHHPIVKLICLALLLVPASVRSQSLATPEYDVSTVRPHAVADEDIHSWIHRGGFDMSNVQLGSLIAIAWGLREDQILGAPVWVKKDRWDVTGKVTEAQPEAMRDLRVSDMNNMMKALLIERFHLKTHLAEKEGRISIMLPAKGGIKLNASLVKPETASSHAELAGGISTHRSNTDVILTGKAVTVKQIVDYVAEELHQTIADQTGLPPAAVYDFSLHYTTEHAAEEKSDSNSPLLREALEKQLGLHLESSRGPTSVLIIDNIERPTAN